MLALADAHNGRPCAPWCTTCARAVHTARGLSGRFERPIEGGCVRLNYRARFCNCGSLTAGALRAGARAPLHGFLVLWPGMSTCFQLARPVRAIFVVMHGYCPHSNHAGVAVAATACYKQRTCLPCDSSTGCRSIMTVEVLDSGMPTAKCWTIVSPETTGGTLTRSGASQDPVLVAVQRKRKFHSRSRQNTRRTQCLFKR